MILPIVAMVVVAAGPRLHGERLRAFADHVEHSLESGSHLGVSVGILAGGESYVAGFGHVDPARTRRVQPDMAFRLASITKCLTAVAVMQLVERGAIALDAEVQRYLPDFPKKKWPLTVGHLLTHQGGVRHYRSVREAWFKSPKSTAEALALFRDDPLEAEPGVRFLYSSYGYNLLGAIVEAVAEEPFGDYLGTHVFGPLTMTGAHLEDARDRRRGPHGLRLADAGFEPVPLLDLSSRFAAGGARASVVDLLRFARGMLDAAVLRPETRRKMWTSQATRDGRLTEYGLGFAVYPQQGRPVVAHAGGQPGATSLLLIYPADDFAVALLTNVEGEAAWLRDVAAEAVAQFLGDGGRRRRVYAESAADRTLHERLYRLMNHGLAAYLGDPSWAVGPAELGAEWALLGAGVTPTSEQPGEQAAPDGDEAAARFELGLHPAGGSVLVRAGARMAERLARVHGPEQLRRYHDAGALAFFADYAAVCESAATSCREGERLPAWLHGAVTRLAPGWARANVAAVRRVRVGSDAAAFEAKLVPSFASATIYPDFSEEIAEQALRAWARRSSAKGGQLDRGQREAEALVRVAASLYPGHLKGFDPAGDQLVAALWRVGLVGTLTPRQPALRERVCAR